MTTRGRVRLPALAALAVSAAIALSGCGGGISDDDRERIEEAALEAVGGQGRVAEVGTADDDETHAFEADVDLDSGGDVEVLLDEDFAVVNQPQVDRELGQEQGGDAGDMTTESPSPGTDGEGDNRVDEGNVDDDTPLEGRIKEQAEQAALDEVGEGRVEESTYADRDEPHVYEVDIDLGNDDDVTVELDEDFNVVRVDR